MRSLILVYISLFLTGCYQSVDRNDIEGAIMICASIGEEVVKIDADFSGREGVQCSNKEYSIIDSNNLRQAKRILQGGKNV